MIIGNTSQEGSSQFDLYDPVSKTRVSPPLPDDAAARTMIAARLGMLYYSNNRAPTGDDVIGHYQQCAREEGRSDSIAEVLKELFGDVAGRHYAVRKRKKQPAEAERTFSFINMAFPSCSQMAFQGMRPSFRLFLELLLIRTTGRKSVKENSSRMCRGRSSRLFRRLPQTDVHPLHCCHHGLHSTARPPM